MVIAWQFHPLSVLLFVSMLVSASVAAYAWKTRDTPGARWLAVVMGCSTLWSLGHGLRLAATTLDAKLLALVALSAPAVGLIPAAWLVFTLAYTGRNERLSRRLILALMLPGVAMFLLALTNPLHELLWRAAVEESGEYALLTRRVQPLYFVHVIYAYALFLAGTGVLVRQVVTTDQLFRRQGVLVLVAALVPFVGNVAWVLGLTGPSVNLTPIGFSVSGTVLAVAISRFGLFDLTPLARDVVVERMRDGYLVVDTDGRIVDANPVGRRLLDLPSDATVVGRPVAAVAPQIADVLDLDDRSALSEWDAADVDADGGAERTVEITDEDGSRQIGVDVSALDFGRFEARLLLLRDVTERTRRVADLRRANRRLERFASVVSHDLRNPLNVATGRCELARTTGDVDHVEKATEALSRMETIIDDVLTLTRAGRSVEVDDVVTLDELARRAWAQVTTGEASLAVEGDVTFEADSARLQRVFENLFRNSIEHGSTDNRLRAGESVEHGSTDDLPSTDGSLAHTNDAITVRVGATADGFFVEDDGPGIDPEHRENVFRFGETTNPNGTGLGLAIVREILTAHGWTVSITESATGGARFEVSDVGHTPAGENPPKPSASD